MLINLTNNQAVGRNPLLMRTPTMWGKQIVQAGSGSETFAIDYDHCTGGFKM